MLNHDRDNAHDGSNAPVPEPLPAVFRNQKNWFKILNWGRLLGLIALATVTLRTLAIVWNNASCPRDASAWLQFVLQACFPVTVGVIATNGKYKQTLSVVIQTTTRSRRNGNATGRAADSGDSASTPMRTRTIQVEADLQWIWSPHSRLPLETLEASEVIKALETATMASHPSASGSAASSTQLTWAAEHAMLLKQHEWYCDAVLQNLYVLLAILLQCLPLLIASHSSVGEILNQSTWQSQCVALTLFLATCCFQGVFACLSTSKGPSPLRPVLKLLPLGLQCHIQVDFAKTRKSTVHTHVRSENPQQPGNGQHSSNPIYSPNFDESKQQENQ